ncbi:MAG: hypothetical protein S4CHLAM81_01170 [Chlamydiales bacterium]|nr:hypothetical protein [Chlamydiales bacterium]MCH9634913.1 hypothetical protein [Chlamydiales bacterium]MCH9704434.1 mechanosensitive ion channel family protein [Chlamydiota bacterium]
MIQNVYQFILPHLTRIAIAGALFLAAYILYHILFFTMKKVAKGTASKVVQGIRAPTLLLFFEAASFLSLFIFSLDAKPHKMIAMITLAFAVLTVGWLVIRTIRVYFKSIIELYKSDPKRKASVIQIQFIYRLLLIAISFITIGAILLLFPSAKQLGIGVLGSAGVVGLVIGMAARPIFLNLMAGFQIAITKTINLDDAIEIDGHPGRVESIHLTYVIVRTWDLKRHIIPISQFIDKAFQNLDLRNTEKLGAIFLYLDYRAPIKTIRTKFEELVQNAPQFNGSTLNLHVVDATANTIKLRLVMTGNDAASTFELTCHIREKLIEYIQKEHPESLPVVRELEV